MNLMLTETRIGWQDAVTQSPNVEHGNIAFDSIMVSDARMEPLRMRMNTPKMRSECVGVDKRFLPVPYQAHCSNTVTVPLCDLCMICKLTRTHGTAELNVAFIVFQHWTASKLQSMLHAQDDLTEGRSRGETIVPTQQHPAFVACLHQRGPTKCH